MELHITNDVLRVAVEDKDTPNTSGWRARYFFIKGNEENHYKIDTDPETNEGILSVIKVKFSLFGTYQFETTLKFTPELAYFFKGKDYEKMSFVTLEVGVKNEESLWVCNDNGSSRTNKDFYDTALIRISVKNINDPPIFAQNPVVLHLMEEEEPGTVLFTAEVKDEDSDVSQIRCVLGF